MSENLNVPKYISRESLTSREQFLNIFSLILLNISLILWLLLGPILLNWFSFYFVSIVFILFHQRMMSEWLHEASHWNLLNNKSSNDFVANLLIFPFLGIPVQLNRKQHFSHHGYKDFFIDNDPDTSSHLVKTKKELVFHILKSLTGIKALMMFGNWVGIIKTKSNEVDIGKIDVKWEYLVLFIFHSLLFAFSLQGPFYYLYPLYFGILLTIYPIFQTIRAWGQHAEIIEDGEAILEGSKVSRSMYGGVMEFLFFNSSVMAFHYEHHKWPSLHYRQLKKNAIISDDPNINGKGCIPIIFNVLKGLG